MRKVDDHGSLITDYGCHGSYLLAIHVFLVIGHGSSPTRLALTACTDNTESTAITACTADTEFTAVSRQRTAAIGVRGYQWRAAGSGLRALKYFYG